MHLLAHNKVHNILVFDILGLHTFISHELRTIKALKHVHLLAYNKVQKYFILLGTLALYFDNCHALKNNKNLKNKEDTQKVQKYCLLSDILGLHTFNHHEQKNK
jgi:hypothetical protein